MIDLHCHILYGVDDGARTENDALEMARALVELGFHTIAASPHNRPEYASRESCQRRMAELQTALDSAAIPLKLVENAENFFLDETLMQQVGQTVARKVGAGPYMLIEAPYTSPLPSLPDIIFRMKLKGVTPLIAHPERCMEFARKGRADEVVAAGALLQLDVGSLIGRYGPEAKKLARQFLEKELYAVGATDLHGPVGAKEWVGKSLNELKHVGGDKVFAAMLSENPSRILKGETLES